MKVLVVDDVGYSRHYHTRLLQKFGFQAESVETGAARSFYKHATTGRGT